MRRLGENALIAEVLAPLATHPCAFGLSDDAAHLSQMPPNGLVITTDALVAGVHFFENDDPGDAAYKAVAVNVSDLAAKAAKPFAYLLTLALPAAPTEDWARAFAGGLARAQAAFGVSLIGGDTVTARGPWWLSVTALGDAPARPLVRGGGRPGDVLYVTGTLGDAALGLKMRLGLADFAAALSTDETERLARRYLYPEPRVSLRPALAAHASAAMDLSDGLALDLTRLCIASGVTATVDASALPLSEAARSAVAACPALIEAIITGGDDYEILAAVPPETASGLGTEARSRAFEAAARDAGCPIFRIGKLAEGAAPPSFLDPSGEPLILSAKGFEHFAL
ncbi:thiamine-monophosphate kinase [Rhodomicrobium udaipurense JA643]|uniref:Thiamine-monophosphate kinase n=1 Tax=Rhodomicrobium udaipurense TaxID=1202716 RepID=A0A8I1KKX3_9HYPH|nr:thiamine-phosphate kinase [Rhodomicrobium udaipurense]KAI96337.1 thiamine-monophosphate kinase [Rhodomicrobium udaipurense JA643]MBJ7542488.1 thiamine-phosphate kinase [Rhodomicrobium udaipurense]